MNIRLFKFEDEFNELTNFSERQFTKSLDVIPRTFKKH